MRIIFAILFTVIFGLIGARLAGPVGDWLLLQPTFETLQPKFESPDQAAYFEFAARLVITGLIGLIGLVVGLIIAGLMRRRLIRREN